MPTRSISGEAVAKAIASASSMPGSQSRMMGVLTSRRYRTDFLLLAAAST
jgi:hypothetical protein